MPKNEPAVTRWNIPEAETLKQATTDACSRVTDEWTELATDAVEWTPLRAPGGVFPATDDARSTFALLDDWTKVTVPFSEYVNLEGGDTFTNTISGWLHFPIPTEPGKVTRHDAIALPDQWAPDRDHHHAWYVKRIDVGPRENVSTWLRFDAVAHVCAVFVNGEEAGRHLGGYTPFEFDLTPLIRSGENVIAIWVQDETAVFFPESKKAISELDCGRGVHNAHFAGVRGGIYLETRRPTHVARNRIKTSIRTQTLSVETWIRGDVADAVISHAVHEWPNGAEPVVRISERAVENDADGGLTKVVDGVAWPGPKLWSPDHPHLYVLRTTIKANGVSETFETRFGFREFWIEGTNFMLNGQPIRLFGDGAHRKELLSTVPEKSLPYNKNTLRFLKKEFHYMSLRLHGSLHPKWALLAADEEGFLVINQTGLRFGRKNFYENGGEEFLNNMERLFEEWYWRDVNNPSCVIWDVENEIIRGQRTPETERWALKLDDFIKKQDPEAIVEHSGAGWYKPDQEIIHVHMSEQYNRIMRTWRESGKVPLILGEFWMGGRGETRLPNSSEYATRLDWHREEARLYREQMLEMRYFGVSGMMPHRLTHWPSPGSGPLWSREDCESKPEHPYSWRFEEPLNEGGRGLAPIVGFTWPRHAAVFDDEPFNRQIVACNDTEEFRSLTVTCEYGEQITSWNVDLAPTEKAVFPVRLNPEANAREIAVSVKDQNGIVIEDDRLAIHPIQRKAGELGTLKRRLVVVPSVDEATAEALKELNAPHEVADSLPDDAENTIVIVPPDVADDALGRTPTQASEYLAAGGRLLILPQTRESRWLPIEFPFASATRTSIPEFHLSGWESTNKDLIYSRDVPVYGLEHPIFDNLEAIDFKEWDPIDGRISDDVFLRPNAVKTRVSREYRGLLGATRRENTSLVEFRVGAGTGVLCQAQASRPRANPAARVMLANLLRHLDGPAWASRGATIGLLGDLSPKKLAVMTGLEEDAFVPAADLQDEPTIVLVGDAADPAMIDVLAGKGATALILSCDTCGRLPGFQVENDEDGVYSATRKGVEDHPLFWGVAGASFLPLEETPAKGALTRIPDDARVLLGGHCRGHSPFRNDWTVDIGFYGLETRDPAGPIAVGRSVGSGEVIATTIEPWNQKSETHRQLLVNLLANGGVAIPYSPGQTPTIDVKRTIPLEFDGRLDDWTNDMEDITFGEYRHATPVPVSGRDAVKGTVADDFDLSAIIYLLFDDANLYVGGIAFSTEEPPNVTLRVDDQTVAVDLNASSVAVNDSPFAGAIIAIGEQTAGDVIDTRALHLTRVHRQTGKSEFVADTKGTTFETAIPWSRLGFEEPPKQANGAVGVVRGDAELRFPVPAKGEPDVFILQLQGSGAVL